MTAPTRIARIRKTLLTTEEAARAVDRVKLLMSLRDFKGKDLWDALEAQGHPGTYSSLMRFLNAGRLPTSAEVESFARFFGTSVENLVLPTGEAGKRSQQRLIEYDLPAPAPRGAAAPAPARERLRPVRAARVDPAELRALTEAIAGLTVILREQLEWQKSGPWVGAVPDLRQVG